MSIIYTYKNMHESQNHYVDQKMPEKKAYIVCFHLCEVVEQTKLTCAERNQNNT